MSLFEDAAQDYRDIINSDIGASLDCTITPPDGVSEPFTCRMSDTAQTIEPGTNQVISGRQVVISVCLSDLVDVGFESIRGIAKETEKPWIVEFDNAIGDSGKFKVSESAPDRSLAMVTLNLEEIS